MVMQFIGEGLLYASIIFGIGAVLLYKGYGKLSQSNPAVTDAAKTAASRKAISLIERLLK